MTCIGPVVRTLAAQSGQTRAGLLLLGAARLLRDGL